MVFQFRVPKQFFLDQMTSTTEREMRNDKIVNGFIMGECRMYKIHVPTDIIRLIFSFFYVRIFDFDYATEDYKVDENTVTNISNSCLNLVAIGDLMDPALKQTHKIKIKIEKLSGSALLGLVPEDYDIHKAMVFTDDSYSYTERGAVYHCSNLTSMTIGFDEHYIVSLILDLNTLSLSCDTVTNSGEYQCDLLVKAGGIDKMKYKWAIALYEQDTSITILDLA